jgi:hypothetical protein
MLTLLLQSVLQSLFLQQQLVQIADTCGHGS